MRTSALSRVALGALLAVLCVGNVQAKTCTVSGGSVAFGLFDPTSAANLDTTGNLTVDCNEKINVVLSLNVGGGAGAGYSQGRKMTRNGGGTLTYNLYANASRTLVLGDGTGGSRTLNIRNSGGNSYTQAIWARIPKGQGTVLGGTYSDIVVATISY
jgi:spore coat protein U-like protein